LFFESTFSRSFVVGSAHAIVCGLLDYALERTTAADAWLSVARVTLSTGVAAGPSDELSGVPVLLGLKLELGAGLDDGADRPPVADATAGELKLRAVAVSPEAWAAAFLAGLADAEDPGGRHTCSGQVTTGLRMVLLPGLAVWRTRTTASAVTSTAGKITAQK
jgi:hypothetical protein